MNLEEKTANDFKNGKEAQKRFAKLIVDNNFRYQPATEFQDKFEHWDLIVIVDLENGKKIFRYIDVKGLKKGADEGYQWMELQTVDERKGWLYAEIMHSLAFEYDDYFAMVSREELLPLIEEKIKEEDKKAGKIIIYDEKKGLGNYQRYQRSKWKNNKDICVKAPIKDWEHLIYAKIHKKNSKIEFLIDDKKTQCI